MKEIKIIIRIDEMTNQIGFAIEKDKSSRVEDILELIGCLDLLKAGQLKKLDTLFHKEIGKDKMKGGKSNNE